MHFLQPTAKATAARQVLVVFVPTTQWMGCNRHVITQKQGCQWPGIQRIRAPPPGSSWHWGVYQAFLTRQRAGAALRERPFTEYLWCGADVNDSLTERPTALGRHGTRDHARDVEGRGPFGDDHEVDRVGQGRARCWRPGRSGWRRRRARACACGTDARGLAPAWSSRRIRDRDPGMVDSGCGLLTRVTT
jgi:hypothetical protein